MDMQSDALALSEEIIALPNKETTYNALQKYVAGRFRSPFVDACVSSAGRPTAPLPGLRQHSNSSLSARSNTGSINSTLELICNAVRACTQRERGDDNPLPEVRLQIGTALHLRDQGEW